MDVKTLTDESLHQRLIDRLWETLPPTWDRIRTHLRGIAVEQFGITVMQFHMLRYIRRGLGVSELAEARQVSRSAASQAVETLVERGFVTRRQSLTDRRCVHLELTESGSALLNGIFEQNRAWLADKTASLGPAETDALLHAMDLLKEAFLDSGRTA